MLEIIESSRLLLEEVTTNNFGLKNANAWATPTHQVSASLLVEITLKMKTYDLDVEVSNSIAMTKLDGTFYQLLVRGIKLNMYRI